MLRFLFGLSYYCNFLVYIFGHVWNNCTFDQYNLFIWLKKIKMKGGKNNLFLFIPYFCLTLSDSNIWYFDSKLLITAHEHRYRASASKFIANGGEAPACSSFILRRVRITRGVLRVWAWFREVQTMVDPERTGSLPGSSKR